MSIAQLRRTVGFAVSMMLAQGVITNKPKLDDLSLLDYQPKT